MRGQHPCGPVAQPFVTDARHGALRWSGTVLSATVARIRRVKTSTRRPSCGASRAGGAGGAART